MPGLDFLAAEWRKSSRSNGTGACVELAWHRSSYSNGGGECVELAWRKSTHSNGAGNCVELSLDPEAGAVRDSKNPSGPILTFPATSLTAFLAQR
jgi:uncharacterized protein DUF397